MVVKAAGLCLTVLLIAGGIAAAVPDQSVTEMDFIPAQGEYRIGDCYGCDARPGTYESAGAGRMCFWSREAQGREIARGHAQPDQAVRVTVTGGETFETRGWCKPWIKVG